jgi:hypothetical protein
MNHRSVYERLLSPENEAALLRVLQEQGVISLVRANHATVRRDHSPPYVLLTVEAEQGVSAHCTCVFLNVGDIVPEQGSVPYYLPVVAIAQLIHADEDRSAIILAHELLHLDDTLALVERDPSYPQRVMDFGMNNTQDPALLDQTIDLEVFKLFSLEPQAFALDYAHGDTALEIPFLGRMIRVVCFSSEEYVHHRMAEYVSGFEQQLSEMHPTQRERIHAEFERAVNKYGQTLLGPSPYARVEEINAAIVTKMLDPTRWDKSRKKPTAPSL